MSIQFDIQSTLSDPLTIYISSGILIVAISIAAWLLIRLRRKPGGEEGLLSRLKLPLQEPQINILTDIQDEMKSLKQDLQEAIRFAVASQERQSRIEGELLSIEEMLSNTLQTVQILPLMTMKKMIEYQEEQEQIKLETEQDRLKEEAARREQEIYGAKRNLKEELCGRYKELSEQSNLLQVSALVSKICNELESESSLPNDLRAIVPPYLEVASKEENLQKKLTNFDNFSQLYKEDLDASIRPTLQSLEQSLKNLDRNHKLPWIIDLLERARNYPSLEEYVKSLESLLELEELNIAPGDELRDYRNINPTVISTDGDGSRSVISEVVEIGYRHKTSGTVLKHPKVRIRFEE